MTACTNCASVSDDGGSLISLALRIAPEESSGHPRTASSPSDATSVSNIQSVAWNSANSALNSSTNSGQSSHTSSGDRSRPCSSR